MEEGKKKSVKKRRKNRRRQKDKKEETNRAIVCVCNAKVKTLKKRKEENSLEQIWIQSIHYHLILYGHDRNTLQERKHTENKAAYCL